MRRRSSEPGPVEYALILVLITLIVLGVAALLNTGSAECAEGYFYSVREFACVPGYRP